jgi:hybrid polyketide synthase/nonribosomal peptide synthetase ACE1
VWPVEDKKPNALEELHSEDQEDVEDIFSDAQEYAESSSSDPNVDSTTSTSEPQQSLGAPSEKRLDSHAYEDEDKLSVQTYANSFQGDTGDHGDWRVKSPHTLPTTPGSHCDDRKRVQRLSLPIFDEKVLRLSFSQNLFWFSAAFTDDPTDLNLTGTFRLTGELDIERLKIAVTDVAKQHESLRTRFFVTDGEPMQGIMYCPLLTLEHFNIQSESELADITNEIHGHVYDLEKGDTVRIALVSLSSHEHFFILSVHHLAMDGQSFFPLMKDMMHHYTRTHDGMKAAQYAEFSEKQHVEYASGGFKEELAFWKSELAEMPSTLPILRTSSLTSRPRLQSYGNNYVDVRIGQDTKALIQALCRRNRVTPFHFYIAVFRVLLLRYSGSEDFSIGIGDANRTEDLMGSIGDFVNILPIVFRTESSAHFDKMLQETRSKTYATLANSRVPFQLLLSELGITRSAITTPIFQAFMDYRLARGGSMSWGDYQLDLLLFKPSKVAYDVAVDIIDNPQGECHLTFITRDDLYDQASTKQLADSYVYLVEALTAQPTAAVSAALMFKDVEVEETLDSGRGKSVSFFYRYLKMLKHANLSTIRRLIPVAELGRDSRPQS